MKIWVVVMLVYLAICALGKIVILYQRDEARRLGIVAVDIIIEFSLLTWGLWELSKI